MSTAWRIVKLSSLKMGNRAVPYYIIGRVFLSPDFEPKSKKGISHIANPWRNLAKLDTVQAGSTVHRSNATSVAYRNSAVTAHLRLWYLKLYCYFAHVAVLGDQLSSPTKAASPNVHCAEALGDPQSHLIRHDIGGFVAASADSHCRLHFCAFRPSSTPR